MIFNRTNKMNNIKEENNIRDASEIDPKNKKTKKGNKQMAITLSNINEKNIPNLANSFIKKVSPNRRIIKNLRR